MLRIGRPEVALAGNQRIRLSAGSLISSAVIVGLGIAGCSADITRFNGLGLSGNQTASTTRPQNYNQSLFDQQPAPEDPALARPYPRNQTGSIGRVERQRLADAAPSPANYRYNADTYAPSAAPANYRSAPARPPQSATGYRPTSVAPQIETAQPETITVQSGDTLYQLARRYGTTVEAIKRANGLTGNIIRPGQQLALSGTAPQPTTSRLPRSSPAFYDDPPAAPVSSGDTYTVQPGDSLYAIARKTGVRVATLRQLNDIRDVRRMMPGTVLRLNDGLEQSTPSLEPATQTQTAPRYGLEPQTRRVGTTPIIINPTTVNRGADSRAGQFSPATRIDNGSANQPRAGERYARVEQPARASTAVPDGKLRWPVSGRIIRGFGKRPDGSQNDGINIAVPVGTDVHAAEAGVVAYAGNELKGYGNLILIRHDNGYVTAYAHGSRMLVRRGDAVRRGQIIAKAGKTGSVSQPQLHFELRKGAKPVDPIPFLSRRL